MWGLREQIKELKIIVRRTIALLEVLEDAEHGSMSPFEKETLEMARKALGVKK